MKKKLKEFFGIITSFAVLIYLGQNSYLLEWLAERYFFFIWVPILLLWFFRKEILARWLSIGAFGGLILGQIAEDMKWEHFGLDNQIAHSSYWGVGTWFTVVIITFGFGILHTWLILKKSRNKQQQAV